MKTFDCLSKLIFQPSNQIFRKNINDNLHNTVGQLPYEGHHLLEFMIFLSLILQKKINQGFASDQWC